MSQRGRCGRRPRRGGGRIAEWVVTERGVIAEEVIAEEMSQRRSSRRRRHRGGRRGGDVTNGVVAEVALRRGCRGGASARRGHRGRGRGRGSEESESRMRPARSRSALWWRLRRVRSTKLGLRNRRSGLILK